MKSEGMGRAALLALAAAAGLGQAVAGASNAIAGFGQALGRAHREAAYQASRHRGYSGAKLARKALKGKVGKTVLR